MQGFGIPFWGCGGVRTLDGTMALGAYHRAEISPAQRTLRSIVTRNAHAIRRSQTAVRRSQMPDPATSEAKGWWNDEIVCQVGVVGEPGWLGCYFLLVDVFMLMCLIKDPFFFHQNLKKSRISTGLKLTIRPTSLRQQICRGHKKAGFSDVLKSHQSNKHIAPPKS